MCSFFFFFFFFLRALSYTFMSFEIKLQQSVLSNREINLMGCQIYSYLGNR